MDLDTLAKRTLQRTWRLHQYIYTVLENTVESVRPGFDPEDYDPWYFTHSIRHGMCRTADSIPEKERWFRRVQHPMSGIEILYLEFRIKVWKVNGGEMPMAGQSPGRVEFLDQRQLILHNYLDSLGAEDLVPLRLFVSWDVDHLLHLGKVKLLCPKSFESPWKPGDEYFTIPIPHPATAVESPKQFTEEPSELEIELERQQASSNDDSAG